MGTYWSTTNPHTYFILCLPYLMVSILFMCIDQCFCMNKSLNSQNPPPFVTVASSNKPCLSHDTHHVLTQWNIHRRAKGNWQHAVRQNFQFFTFLKKLKLFCGSFMWQIAVLPQFMQQVNWSSLRLYCLSIKIPLKGKLCFLRITTSISKNVHKM